MCDSYDWLREVLDFKVTFEHPVTWTFRIAGKTMKYRAVIMATLALLLFGAFVAADEGETKEIAVMKKWEHNIYRDEKKPGRAPWSQHQFLLPEYP